MPRVGTCKDCGARFKIPDTVTARAAKCAKCGGTVDIPPAEAAGTPAAAAPVPPPAAPSAPRPAAAPPRPVAAAPAAKAPAPAARAPAAPERPRPATPGRAPRAGGATPPTSKTGGARTRGRTRAGAGREGRGDKPASKKSPVLWVILAVVVLGGAVAAYFAFSGPDAPPAETTGPTTGEAAAPADPAAGAEAAPAADEPVPVEAAPVAADTPADAGAAAPSAAEPAAAPAPAAQVDSTAPRDPIVAIAPLGPVPGTTDEQLAEWTALVKAYYVEDPGPKQARQLRAQLEEIDIVDATPAFVNSLIGLDMSKETDIRNAGNLVQDWDERQGHQIKFFFDLDASRNDTVDINKRIQVIEIWRNKFEEKMNSPKLLEEYRANAAASLAQRKAKDQ